MVVEGGETENAEKMKVGDEMRYENGREWDIRTSEGPTK